jgi:RHS repeat-associated protein
MRGCPGFRFLKPGDFWFVELIQGMKGMLTTFKDYVYMGGQHAAEFSGGQTYFVHGDHLGSTRTVTDYAGNVSDALDYLPYGEQIAGDAFTTHKFTGKERDSETGNDYFGARYNSSSIGRFISPDPLLNSGHPSNPQTWNRYSYALNNPLSIIDPTGLYDLVNTCDDTDKECNQAFQQYARKLKDGLSDLEKQLQNVIDPIQKARLESALKAFGTQGDNNGVNVSFGKLPFGTAAVTVPNYNSATGQETYNVTFDPRQTNGLFAYAINAAHEGTHISDLGIELANPMGQPVLSNFSYEYRGYETSAWTAQALGVGSLKYGANIIWNTSWWAADRQTLMDKGIMGEVTGTPYNYKETIPHNPWPN